MRIAVLTNWPTSFNTLRLIEEAQKRGHEAVAINARNCYLNVEKDKPAVFYGDRELDNIDAIIPRFTQSANMYGSAVVRQFELQGIYTTATSLAIVRASDKLRSLQLMAKAGIPIPKTVFASQPGNTKQIIEEVGGAPVIIKLIEGSQGSGVALAETSKAAISVVQAFNELKANIIVQEFIKEAEGSDIRVFVVGNRVVASMVRQGGEGDFRSNLHQGGQAKSIKLTQEQERMAIKAAKRLGLSIAGVDMLISAQGPLIIEVNATPGLEGIEAITKRNIAEKIIEYVERNAKQRRRKDKVGA